jgi:aryl-alcohol dehydrogenase-like predicted oxidoreductase
MPVAMGCWPIAGMTSVNVNERDSLETLRAAWASGINFFDTAYAYGANGESERMIARALGEHRREIVIATKCGIHWNEEVERQIDGRPERIKQECDESLRRLHTDHVELLYLHAPDPHVPVAESAGALKELMDAGKTRAIGVSNFDVPQLEAFHAVCPIAAFQPAYNMLQRQIERDTLPWCRERGISVMVYWPLMKGLLAGRLPRDHVFEPGDGRAKYPMFQGEEWQKNQDFLDRLRAVAKTADKTVSQVVINWTIHQTGITCALCGAKRPYQIEESAGAMNWRLTPDQLSEIDRALADRGEAVVGSAV